MDPAYIAVLFTDPTGRNLLAAAVVSLGTGLLAESGRGLLGYLAERDRILEAERDTVLGDVLDEFAQGLSPSGLSRLREPEEGRRARNRPATARRRIGSGACSICRRRDGV